MKRLLWFGDACCATGFATVTHSVLEHLRQTWDVHVCGVNYHGDPHSYPYPVYPAAIRGDTWGVMRFRELVDKIRPDVVVINNDAWNIVRFPYHSLIVHRNLPEVPIVGYVPVDGTNFNETVAKQLEWLAGCIWYTDFGKAEAEKAGYKGKSFVIPHGVHERYKPMDKVQCRREIGLPEDAFIVGNVNRNSFRKRLDITMRAFKRFLDWKPDAYLYLHCKEEGDEGINVPQYVKHLGLDGRVIVPKGLSTYNGFGDEQMPMVYNSFDMQVSTTMGEGWGLTTMEAMACGIPQAVPHHSALPEWCGDHVEYVHNLSPLISPYGMNVELFQADEEEVSECMILVDVNHDSTRNLRASQYVSQPRFRWENIAKEFDKVLTSVVESNEPAQAGKVQELQASAGQNQR